MSWSIFLCLKFNKNQQCIAKLKKKMFESSRFFTNLEKANWKNSYFLPSFNISVQIDENVCHF